MKRIVILIALLGFPVVALIGVVLHFAMTDPTATVPATRTPASTALTVGYSLPTEVSATNVNREAAATDFLAEGDQIWVGDHYWTFHQFDGRLYLGHHTQGQDLVVKSEDELATPQAIGGVNGEGLVFLVGPVIRSKNGPAVLIVRGYESGPQLEIRAVFPVGNAVEHECKVGIEDPGVQPGKWIRYEGSRIYSFGKLLLLDFTPGFTYMNFENGVYSDGFVGETITEPAIESAVAAIVYHCGSGKQWITLRYDDEGWFQLVPLP